ncbi:hypothetical protein [Lactiplantibacillus herbarum]|uniref:hypothetical protein n=1 Tax=Lactiplantibacillus herbarum TaxID=1670446 RepID=UPI00064ED437|nr:hypothetical protein [Lactiplantibacillus herbarum]
MIKMYHKTATIMAEQFNDTNDAKFVQIVRKYKLTQPEPFSAAFHLPTVNSDMRINYGDWIVTGDKGEHWAIADDVFKQTYAELPVIPQAVADYIEKCKYQHRSLASALVETDMPTDVQDYFRNYQSIELWISLQDNFARVWLDWDQVEEPHED